MVDDRNSVKNTLIVAIGLSIVCSILVAGTAVILKPKQEQNATDFRQRIILEVAGLYVPGTPPDLDAAGIEARLVDLDTGEYVDSEDAAAFDPVEAARDPAQSINIPAEFDIASVRRRSALSPVYVVRDGDAIDQIILPVRGAGLWSTMYGYIALDNDGNTIRGLRFYEHAETPGLGDQVDRPEWRAQWEGKRLFSDSDEIIIEVVRGTAPENDYQIDGLAGATLTARGVMNLVHYWVGGHGYGPYLERVRGGRGES